MKYQIVIALLFCAGTVLGAALPAWADMEEDALRTREGLVRTLDVLKGRSDRTLIQAFRKEFPQFKAKTLEIRCLEDGGKLTSIIWTAEYRRRAATPRIETLPSGGSYVTRKYYEVKPYTIQCTARFLSHGERIESYTLEGEGCIW